MSDRSRFFLAAILAVGLVASALPSQAYDTDQQKCRSAVFKSGANYAKTTVKTMTGCGKNRDKGTVVSGTDCNDIAAADTANKVPGAATKAISGITGKCTGSPSAVGYEECPAPCAGVVTTFADLGDCLVCLTDANSQDYSGDANGLPTAPITDPALATCHAAILKNSSKLYNAVLKSVAKCQKDVEKGGSESITTCTDTTFNTIIQKDFDKALDSLVGSCPASLDPVSVALDPCGGATTSFDLISCVVETARDDAKALAIQYLELPLSVVTTTTTTTTTTMLVGDPLCPNQGELVIYSRMTNEPCTVNADCTAPHFCNTSAGICSTVTHLDSGWTGAGHDADLNDLVATKAHLYCPGPGPVCGECNVTGIDPEPGNCRCANNRRTICDQPFQNDANDCGGAYCQCFFGAPFPLNSAGVQVCVVNYFAADLTGTANVDAGSGAITATLRTRLYTGITGDSPCPVCAGKCSDTMAVCKFNSDCTSNNCVQDVLADGIRNGLCMGGASNGLSCDSQAVNASFPAVVGATSGGGGGGGFSLDCSPTDGSNLSGQGLSIRLQQTTGTSTLPSGMDCDAGGAGTDLCQCLVCSIDASVPCSANGDCASQGGKCALSTNTCNSDPDCTAANIGPCRNVGGFMKCDKKTTQGCTSNTDCLNQNVAPCGLSACTSAGATGIFPQPNACDGGLCTDIGGGEAECTTGPDEYTCDGLVRADGTGMTSCDPSKIPPADDCSPTGAGGCTLVKRKKCFNPTIEATGNPDPVNPVAAATFCIPPLAGAIPGIVGFPGPGRVINQGSAKTFCANDHNVQYTPGVGGCPP